MFLIQQLKFYFGKFIVNPLKIYAFIDILMQAKSRRESNCRNKFKTEMNLKVIWQI